MLVPILSLFTPSKSRLVLKMVQTSLTKVSPNLFKVVQSWRQSRWVRDYLIWIILHPYRQFLSKVFWTGFFFEKYWVLEEKKCFNILLSWISTAPLPILFFKQKTHPAPCWGKKYAYNLLSFLSCIYFTCMWNNKMNPGIWPTDERKCH